MILKFHDTFRKSVGEYNRKFVLKCFQITIYQLSGLYVSESYVEHELRCLVRDPLVDEYFPE